MGRPVRLSGEGWRSRDNADLVRLSLGALNAALEAADPRSLVRNSLKLRNGVVTTPSTSFRLSDFQRVLVIGGGKASGAMAAELDRMLGATITDGVVNIPDYQKAPRRGRIRFNPSSHPFSDSRGAEGVRDMLRLTSRLSESDLVFCLISSGASSLMPAPISGLSLGDKTSTTRLLLENGATIEEVNTVRKHLSRIKGGRLAQKLHPATVVSLILSDVVGDQLCVIGSGPTSPDTTTFSDSVRVLEKHMLLDRVPKSVIDLLRTGMAGKTEETPKAGSRAFANVHNVLIGSNRVAREAAARYLSGKGLRTIDLTSELAGEARALGTELALKLSAIRTRGMALKPTALVGGGETTVTVRGKGSGGRNQEVALAAAVALAGTRRKLIAALATDGVDGPTDAAGAVSDGTTVGRAWNVGLDAARHLEQNDSHTFFKKLGDLLVTGPTGTGVNDVFIALKGV